MKRAILILIFLMAVTSLAAENVNLFWDANSEPDVTFYNVHRGAIEGGPYLVIGTVPQSVNPMYSDLAVNLTADKFYVVTAVNNAGAESAFSNEGRATAVVISPIPEAPTITLTVTVTVTVSP